MHNMKYENHEPIMYTITEEECRQLEREYEYEDIIQALYKALAYCKSKDIQGAIEELSSKSRFKGNGY